MRHSIVILIGLLLSGCCCAPNQYRTCGSGACATPPPQHHHHSHHDHEHIVYDEVQHPVVGVNGAWSLMPHSAFVPYVNQPPTQPTLPE